MENKIDYIYSSVNSRNYTETHKLFKFQVKLLFGLKQFIFE